MNKQTLDIIYNTKNISLISIIETQKELERQKREDYEKTKKCKETKKRYRQSEKGKKAIQKAKKKYFEKKYGVSSYYEYLILMQKKNSKSYQKGLSKTKQYQKTKEGKKSLKKAQKKYRQTDKGKQSAIKSKTKRKRNLKFIELIPNIFHCKIHYHHINNFFIISLPKNIHLQTNGKKHKEKCKKIIEKYYKIDIDIFLKP